MQMKKVLVISYHTPPLAGAGSFRTLKFVKYLRDFGYDCSILSVAGSKFAPVDKTLLEGLPKSVNIYRSKSIESKIMAWGPSKLGMSSKLMLLPDEYVGWYPFAMRKVREIIRREEFDLIYATAPPYTALLIGCSTKELIKKPLVVDFRDPWTQNIGLSYPSMVHRSIDETLERKVVHHSDGIIITTEPNRAIFMEKYKEIPSERCVTLTNGYDPEDFLGIINHPGDKFTISHIGSLYGSRSPGVFLSALRDCANMRPSLMNDIQINLVGKTSKEFWNLAKEYGMDQVVHETGYVSHAEAIQFMIDASVLLLVIGGGQENVGVLTGKVFEYIASRKPILSLAPVNGAASDLIAKTRTGTTLEPSDAVGIQNAILNYYDMWKSGSLSISPDISEIEKYDRRKLTGSLAKLFDRVIGG